MVPSWRRLLVMATPLAILRILFRFKNVSLRAGRDHGYCWKAHNVENVIPPRSASAALFRNTANSSRPRPY